MNSLTVVDPERFLGSVRWRQLFDMDEQIHAQIARLESDVQHIHIVVSDIKVDLRRTNDKIDATNSRVDVLRDKLEQGFREVNARVDGVQERLTGKIEGVREDLTQRIEGVREGLTQKIGGVREDLTQKIEGVRGELTQKIESVREDLTQKIEGVRGELTQRIESVREDLTQKIEGVRVDLTQRIEGVREDLTQKIEGVREDLTSVRHDIASMKVWAMGLYFALAGSLLFVMAKGFKWL
jgi:archaellum component FlaC